MGRSVAPQVSRRTAVTTVAVVLSVDIRLADLQRPVLGRAVGLDRRGLDLEGPCHDGGRVVDGERDGLAEQVGVAQHRLQHQRCRGAAEGPTMFQ